MKQQETLHLLFKLKHGNAFPSSLRFDSEPKTVTVGRSEESGLRLFNDTASRSHAVLDWDGKNLRVTDLESHNGTSVNGTIISSTTLLFPGAELIFADVSFDVLALKPPQWSAEKTRVADRDEIDSVLRLAGMLDECMVTEQDADTTDVFAGRDPDFSSKQTSKLNPDITHISKNADRTMLWQASPPVSRKRFFNSREGAILAGVIIVFYISMTVVLSRGFFMETRNVQKRSRSVQKTALVDDSKDKASPSGRPPAPKPAKTPEAYKKNNRADPPELHEAVDALMSGRFDEAEELYRKLAHAHPERRDHGLILEILEKRKNK